VLDALALWFWWWCGHVGHVGVVVRQGVLVLWLRWYSVSSLTVVQLRWTHHPQLRVLLHLRASLVQHTREVVGCGSRVVVTA
jgi:hypothetical protein